MIDKQIEWLEEELLFLDMVAAKLDKLIFSMKGGSKRAKEDVSYEVEEVQNELGRISENLSLHKEFEE